ncbi:hypothetical protein VOI32_37200 [Paraburkholderia caribensis]|jgi:hypothetical protein|uniref:Uncharacterized protein n=1 Tax=Paraburkholderia caribensis TaxID=75105 RepID=A0A9Q6WMA7_9BURK|nr:hypothetical protein [Paraburkholderia caribensis]AMV42523.1 hypothetical protein ATN79_07505 [Paraburkholderia caribensis]MCO4877857.1 hypothetical protein [Paraburkholderia caribensis]PTB22992.1 hypothetical protein C9I56_41585 [Paraburkholderia caribensis]QLB63797.1 hypothetical protein A9O66_01815 [Paraburkholderia caribensis]
MHPSRRARRIHHSIHAMLINTALACATSVPLSAHADDAPSPCTALKRIVAAAPTGFSQLTPEDGKGVAQPYGADAQCGAAKGSYECSWTPSGGAGSGTAALQAVAADIASCLPDATHDVNSPARQHFYIGPRETRTQITAMPAGANKVKLVVSGK